MKKTIFLIAALAGALLSGNAQTLKLDDSRPIFPRMGVIQKASETDGDENSIIFGYCGDVYSGLGTGQRNQTLDAAIYVPEATAQKYKGCEITKLFIGYGQSSYTRVVCYIADELDGNYTVKAPLTASIRNGWNEVALDTPYVIGDKGFYIGYQTKTSATTDYPIGIDGIPTTDPNANFIGINGNFAQYGDQYGAVCIRAEIKGGNLPSYDVSLISGETPEFVGVNDPFSMTLNLSNNGAKTIENLQATCTLGGKTLEDITMSLSPSVLSPGARGTLTVSGLKSEAIGTDIPLTFTVTGINGQPDENPADNTYSGTVTCVDKMFKQNVVVEEFMGTWCGWCVRGIIGMKYMQDKYGDDGFIGIAAHNDDPMAFSAYQNVIYTYASSGFPSATMNRSVELDPNSNDLEYYYKILSQDPAPAGVEVAATAARNGNSYSFDVEATTEFAFDQPNANYALSFVVIEDNVGPYPQNNYYSGGSNGPMGGWETLPSKVEIEFNEVARVINTAFGISGSIPSSVERNTQYTYKTTINTTNISKLWNCHVVAMLLDTKTGRVVNAAKVTPYFSGVEGIADDSNSAINISGVTGGILVNGNVTDVNVYAIDGSVVRTSAESGMINVAPGIYIVKAVSADGQGTTVKVLVK